MPPKYYAQVILSSTLKWQVIPTFYTSFKWLNTYKLTHKNYVYHDTEGQRQICPTLAFLCRLIRVYARFHHSLHPLSITKMKFWLLSASSFLNLSIWSELEWVLLVYSWWSKADWVRRIYYHRILTPGTSEHEHKREGKWRAWWGRQLHCGFINVEPEAVNGPPN